MITADRPGLGLLVLLVALAASGAPNDAGAGGGPMLGTLSVRHRLRPASMDAIRVFYPRGPCGDRLALELWDRTLHAWRPHPVHARVPVETCQLEDAGSLLNEIRWRCEEGSSPTPWHVGLEVFNPAITESCVVGELEGPNYRVAIHVAGPPQGSVVRTPDRRVRLDGSLRIDGVEGPAYDVILAIDRSDTGPDPAGRLAAQIDAARSWLAHMAPRLGRVRVGLVSYPHPSPARRDSRKGVVEASLGADAAALSRALDALAAQGPAGPAGFAEGLEQALTALLRSETRGGVRATARRVLAIAADGRTAPFAKGASADPMLTLQLRGLADRARRHGVRLHLLALGGYAEAPGRLLAELVQRSHGRFSRVVHTELRTPFFDRVKLPLPQALVVINPLTGTKTAAHVDADGHFTASVPVESGINHLALRARASDGTQGEGNWIIEFDAGAYLELVLEIERERLERERQLQRKALRLDPEAPAVDSP